MKIQDILEANQAVLRRNALKEQLHHVENDGISIIIGNMYQDAKMIEAAKAAIVNELERRISIEEAYLIELGFEIED